MAQGNIIQGQASGKLGDTVLMVRNGTQVSRVYTTSGARSGDAASEAARMQRVRFGAASNQWQLYRYICTRMFRKGRKTNQSDYNYFVKRNVGLLPYLTKLENADGVACVQPGQFSEGTLGRIELVQTYSPSTETAQYLFQLVDTLNPSQINVQWGATIAQLKRALAAQYPNARKLTYLFMLTSTIQLEEGSETFSSQAITYEKVVVDLYSEIEPGENQMTCSAYFAKQIKNEVLAGVFSAATGTCLGLTVMFNIYSTEAAGKTALSNTAALIFATNDLVNDCYSTVLPETGVPLTTGAYTVWAGYRTEDALQVAADSYGYQSGVLRDDIASSNATGVEAMHAYVSRLKKAAPELAADYEEALKSADGVQIKSSRSVVSSSEE